MAKTIEIKLGDILKDVSEAKKSLIKEVLQTLLDMGAKAKINLEDTEIYLGRYKLSFSGELQLKTELTKQE